MKIQFMLAPEYDCSNLQVVKVSPFLTAQPGFYHLMIMTAFVYLIFSKPLFITAN